MNQSEILIIGVIYNTYPEAIRYLDSIPPEAATNISLILVDNSNTPEPDNFIAKVNACSFIHYLKTGKNLGYFGGAREGLNYYLHKFSSYPHWILVTNVDIVFTPSFFNRLSEIKDHACLGVVAPSIISKKWNTDYNPKILVRNSKGKILFYQFLYSNFLFHNSFLIVAYIKKWVLGKVQRKNNHFKVTDPKRIKIYAPHGACLVFHSTYFMHGGNLELPNFLFGEEIMVAETALKSGLDIEYHPELVIHDYEHASVGFFVTTKINRYYKESNQAILTQYYRED